MSDEEITYRSLKRPELDLVLDWAATEGWNPGLQDAEAFWATDPEAFWGIERAGELIGSGAIVSYGGTSGFMGLFIVRPEWRGQGLGRKFWYFRRDKLRRRLRPAAPIAMDGVFAMQDFYAEGGFVFTHRNLRMEGRGQPGPRSEGLVELHSLPLAEVLEYDRKHSGASRPAFLELWIHPKGGLGLGLRRKGGLAGAGVLRPCREGFKIGPLFADDPGIAEEIFVALSDHAAGEPLFLDTPENNPAALALAGRHGMQECFGCARMVLGQAQPLPWTNIFGVTTFELG